MTNLSIRLETIYSFIPSDCVYISDIGADHGKLELKILQNNFNAQIYCCENKIGPFKGLKKNLQNYKNVHVDFASGLANIPSKNDIIIIAGMGGKSIRAILCEKLYFLKDVKYLLLSPHKDEDNLRILLNEINFKCIKEKYVYENKQYYLVMLYTHGNEELSPLDIKYGKLNLKNKDPTFLAYINEKKAKINYLLSNKNLSLTRKEELENELKELNSL